MVLEFKGDKGVRSAFELSKYTYKISYKYSHVELELTKDVKPRFILATLDRFLFSSGV